MDKLTASCALKPEATFKDVFNLSYLRRGARALIANAVEEELSLLLEEHSKYLLPDGRQAIVRNGYLHKRTIQTGIGYVEIEVPKVRRQKWE